MGDFKFHAQSVAVLHGGLPRIAPAGFVTRTLLEQPGIGVRGSGVGVDAARLAFEVHLSAASGRRGTVIVLALAALMRSPGLNERAVHAEVFVTGQPYAKATDLHPFEEGTGQVFVD